MSVSRTTGSIARGDDGRITLGMADQNPQSTKIISAKFCKRLICEILSFKNWALYSCFKMCKV